MPKVTHRKSAAIHHNVDDNIGNTSATVVADGGKTLSKECDADIFVDPMLGGPLPMFVERDVSDAPKLIDLIMKHGGQVSSGYSNVNYIIVNPLSNSGKNLARQYAGKKGKVVLASNWITECIRKGELLTFKSDWAGFRLDGYDSNERPQTAANILSSVSRPMEPIDTPVTVPPRGKKRPRQSEPEVPAVPPPPLPQAPSPSLPPNVYPLTVSQIATQQPLGSWQLPQNLPPPGMAPPPMQRMPGYPPGAIAPPPQMQPATLRPPWETFSAPPPPGYAFHYPAPGHWDENPYYPHFQAPPPPPPAYPPEEAYVGQPFTTPPSDAAEHDAAAEVERGRSIHRASRTSTSRQSIAQSGASRTFRKPLARSPTPPTRIMKSTFGGNLFTSEDILYLKKYIDYCQQQGLILSLREICERLAIRAPHHTFYSWRRFCNKHQIKLGAYDMSVFKASVEPDVDGEESGESGLERDGEEQDDDEDEEVRNAILGPTPILSPLAPGRGRTVQAPAASGYLEQSRDRSPTPPKTLYRSTTGKGVAFTEEDVRYLLRYLQYAQGQDMVQVWRDIALKAPHHSRASWMKYWRRHKHEFDTDRPPTLPQAGPDEPATKRRRYDREDDIKLARLMLGKPAGTSDQIFQSFAMLPENAHHPWKGWQEHHRIHKAKIDHVLQQMELGTFKD
ncbi:hypothetical protein DACRYDRAFT_119444 [Dacryopinax primogenitus]|uniref:BRCT domain-containing protein n=1 Tax=Dacryopinax primogenitus (strain DJM 731) TaxID=1858805 RepID=M5FVG5_DACPD|nr:uncharacterized protein DACRYDRAFT_119444 [Dacryopinax primogenitus]EJT97321.1 hypothetical protein DACRYDRAFT_119444 [Dacryopinax primogenitus]